MRISTTCYHEAGHSIGAEVMGLTTISASVVRIGQTGGRVHYQDLRPGSADRVASLRAWARANAITAFCGPVAGSVHSGEALRAVLQYNHVDLQTARRGASLFALSLDDWHPGLRVTVFK